MTVSNAQIITAISSAMLFIVMWRVLSAYLFKPFLAVLEQREARTVGDERRAHEILAKAEEVRHRIEEELKGARLQGLALRDQAVTAAREKAKMKLDQAADLARRELEAGRAEIERMKIAASREVEQEAEELSRVMLTRILTTRGEQTIH